MNRPLHPTVARLLNLLPVAGATEDDYRTPRKAAAPTPHPVPPDTATPASTPAKRLPALNALKFSSEAPIHTTTGTRQV